VWLVAAILICLLVVVGVVQGVRALKRTARRLEQAERLRQVWLSLQNFDDTYKRLPPPVRKDQTGRVLCSWRYQSFSFLEVSIMNLPSPDWGEPWDSPANDFWAHQHIPFYCWLPKESPEGLNASVVAITGPGTPWQNDREIRFKDLPGDTILLVELAHSGTNWMAPGDLSLDSLPASLTKGEAGDGFNVLFADGEVWFLSADVPLTELKNFCTIERAKKHDREQSLGRYAVSRQRPSSR
jgi:hypothetical protein